jgi:hypothetical protein
MTEPCTMSHDLSCQAFATYEVEGRHGKREVCGVHLSRVIRYEAVGNQGVVTVRVLRG